MRVGEGGGGVFFSTEKKNGRVDLIGIEVGEERGMVGGVEVLR